MKKILFLLAIFNSTAGITAPLYLSLRPAYKDTTISRFDKFHESKITQCEPKGWLLEFLKRQRSGLTGHPEVLSYPFNSCLWAGVISRENETHGDNWWRYEQTAYYSDGLLRLGYLLKDKQMVQKATSGIDYTLAHKQKNGRLGPDLFSSQWPIAVYFRVLQAQYQASGDQKIIDALHAHYLSYTPEDIGLARRAIVNLEGMLWTYGKTGDKKLLKLAEEAYALGGFELNLSVCLSDDKPVFHGVTYMEMAKLPAILYTYTGKKQYLDAALNAFRKLDEFHMLPDGVPSSNEFLAGKDPLQSHETCDISDYTWAAGYMLMATGDAAWADKIEKAVFNAGPGAVSKDFKNLQYFSSVNQVIATGNSNHNKHAYGSTWMAYWPCHQTECCAGNVHRFMPNFAARMWMRNLAGGPVAALYGPSVEHITLKDNIGCEITEETNYPFSERVRFTFKPDKDVHMPFTFRIPNWCLNASLQINGQKYTGKLTPGKYITVTRKFKKNDVFDLYLPMLPKLINYQGAATVQRGPVLYAFAISEKVKTDNKVYKNLGGKRSGDPAFPALDLRPAGPWNYALAVSPANFSKKISIEFKSDSKYPFDPGEQPVVIKVPAKRVTGWKIRDERFTSDVPAPGTFSCENKIETISLVPYGSTRLRISVFPVSKK